MNRLDTMNLLEKASDTYSMKIRYLSPELIIGGRCPIKLVRRMVECVPEGDNNLEQLCEDIVMVLYRAVSQDLGSFKNNFWEYMSSTFLPDRLENIDTAWCQKMFEYWVGIRDINDNP
jgi:hypothetical protein